MVPTLGIVEARPPLAADSRDNPIATIARRRIGGKSLLEWLVRRASDAQWLERIVVLAANDAESQALVSGLPPDVEVVACAAPDGLGRLVEAARKLKARSLVRMHVGNPFVDPEMIDQLIASAATEGCDYAGFAFRDGRPVIASKLGIFAEWCYAPALAKAAELAREPLQRADATRFLWTNPESFSVRLLPIPDKLHREDVRLSIQSLEDWEHVQDLLDMLGPESLDWRIIFSLLERQSACRSSPRSRAEARVG